MRRLISNWRGLMTVILFALPMTAVAFEAPKEAPKAAVPVLETNEFKCYSAPAVCNCMGEANCKALQSSGNCKENTYTFHAEAGIGTCIFRPGA